jgi:hypothetical protein
MAPFPGSKGRAFPFPLIRGGCPTASAKSLRDRRPRSNTEIGMTGWATRARMLSEMGELLGEILLTEGPWN